MSAVGDPRTLADVHASWFATEPRVVGAARATIVIRRRSFDLLRGDARRARHVSLPLGNDEVDDAVRAPDPELPPDPRRQAEQNQVVDRVQRALHGFAAQGAIQARQATLVQRYVLEEVPCAALADEMGCTRNALGVRVHKAMHALRRYIEAHHPELDVRADQRATPADRKIVRGSMLSRVTQRGSCSSGSCRAASLVTPSVTALPIDRRLPSAP